MPTKFSAADLFLNGSYQAMAQQLAVTQAAVSANDQKQISGPGAGGLVSVVLLASAPLPSLRVDHSTRGRRVRVCGGATDVDLVAAHRGGCTRQRRDGTFRVVIGVIRRSHMLHGSVQANLAAFAASGVRNLSNVVRNRTAGTPPTTHPEPGTRGRHHRLLPALRHRHRAKPPLL